MKKYLIYSALTAGILLASCTDEENKTQTGERVAVGIQAGIHTRVVNNQWEDNDIIGLYMVDTETTRIAESVDNYRYNHEGSGVFKPEKAIAFYPADGGEVDLYVYYPYSSTITGGIIPVDVTDQSDENIDLLTATSAGHSNKKTDVHFTFRHRLTRIIFTLDNSESGIDVTGATITITGMKTLADYDLLTDQITTKGDDTEVVIPESEGAYDIITLPREAGAGVKFEVTLPDGGTFTAAMSDKQILERGKKNTFNLKLRSHSVEVSADVEDWIDEGITNADAVMITTPPNETTHAAFENGGIMVLTDGIDYGIYTFNRAAESWDITKALYWNETMTDVQFQAVYPAPSGANSFEVDADTQPNLLYAVYDAVASDRKVELTFNHRLTRLTFTLDNSENSMGLGGALIKVKGLHTKGDYELLTDKLTPKGASSEITLTAVEGVYELIALPREAAAGVEFIIEFPDGTTFTSVMDSNLALERGTHIAFNLIMRSQQVEVSADVTAWTDESKSVDAVLPTYTPDASTYSDFEDGGIMLLNDGTANLGVYKYNSVTTSWDARDALTWDETAATTHFQAAYPIPSGANNAELKISDQSDLLYAVCTANRSDRKVALEFNHRLSKLTLALNNSEIPGGVEMDRAKVVVKGIHAQGKYDLLNDEITLEGTTGEIEVPYNSSQDTYTTLLFPRTAGSGVEFLVKLKNGNEYTAILDPTQALVSNTHYKFDLKLQKEPVQVSATIADWDDETAPDIEADAIVPEADESQGFVDGKILALYTSGQSLAKYTYNGTDKKWDVVNPLIWRYDLPTMDFHAIYPYATALPTDENAMEIDLTDQSTGTADLEYMAARKSVSVTGMKLNLDFDYIMTMLEFRISIKAENGEVVNPSDLKMMVNNVHTTGSYKLDVNNDALTRNSSPGNITLPITDNNDPDIQADFIAHAVVFPGTTAPGMKITLEANGITYEASIGSIDYVAGTKYIHELTLKNGEINLSASMPDGWETGDTHTGDFN